MKIGILSDTHKKVGRAKKAIDMLLDNGAEFLIHAGDIGKIEILEYFKEISIPYTAVLGNNDRKLVDLIHLCFGNVFSIDTTDTFSFSMNIEHYAGGYLTVQIKKYSANVCIISMKSYICVSKETKNLLQNKKQDI